jgi:hypothetical protein
MVWVQFTWHIHYGMGTIYMAHTLWYGYNLHGTYTMVWVQFTWHIHYGMGTIYNLFICAILQVNAESSKAVVVNLQ